MDEGPLVTRLHLYLLGGLAAITAAAFVKIPESTGLPVHWGFDGQPDRFWPRNEALLVMPVVAILVTVLFWCIGRFAPAEQVQPGRHISVAALTGVLGLCCALQFALILIGIGSEIDMVRIVAFLLAAFWIGLGVVFPHSSPNPYAGLRLPWTVNDPANWKVTHLVTGVLMVLGGIGLGLVAWLLPDPPTLLGAIGLSVLVPVLLGALFSFIMSRRRR